MSEEQKISQRYRELPREEPPRALDDAILAASRRAVASRPAPLVVPAGRRRWYFPLAAAAVIVLAVAVTVHVERQQDKLEVAEAPVAAPPPAASEEPVATQPKLGAKRERYAPDPKPAPAPAPERPPLADLQKAQKAPSSEAASPPVAAATPPPPADVREAEARQKSNVDALAMRRDEAPRPQARSAPARAAESDRAQELAAAGAIMGRAAVQSPEQWLQGIDDLKRQGRHDEAEKQLAEFRKRYPDYRIPEAILEKFERR